MKKKIFFSEYFLSTQIFSIRTELSDFNLIIIFFYQFLPSTLLLILLLNVLSIIKDRIEGKHD